MFQYNDTVQIASPGCFYNGAEGRYLHTKGRLGAVELADGEVGYFYLSSLVLVSEAAA